MWEEALSACNLFHAQTPDERGEILRARAHVYVLMGLYELAIADRKEIVHSGLGLLRDYFQLADNSISIGCFDDAEMWLGETLRLGSEQGEDWFESAALLLLAFVQLELGEIESASEALDRVVQLERSCAMPVRGRGMVDAEGLRRQIDRRNGASALGFHCKRDP